MPKVEMEIVPGAFVTPRTIRDQIQFILLNAHMNGFTSAKLTEFQPEQNQNLWFLVSEKRIEHCGGERWKLTETGLKKLREKYPRLFGQSEMNV